MGVMSLANAEAARSDRCWLWLMALTVNDQKNNAHFCEKSANNAKIMFEFDIMVGAL